MNQMNQGAGRKMHENAIARGPSGKFVICFTEFIDIFDFIGLESDMILLISTPKVLGFWHTIFSIIWRIHEGANGGIPGTLQWT